MSSELETHKRCPLCTKIVPAPRREKAVLPFVRRSMTTHRSHRTDALVRKKQKFVRVMQKGKTLMILEEAIEQFTDEMRTAINSVGEKEVVVKLLANKAAQEIDKTAEKLYIVLVAEPKQPGFNGQILGVYPNVEEVKKHFMGLSFTSDIDPNGWLISPEKGGW